MNFEISVIRKYLDKWMKAANTLEQTALVCYRFIRTYLEKCKDLTHEDREAIIAITSG